MNTPFLACRVAGRQILHRDNEGMSIDVRPEDPRDFAAVRSLVARAFTDAEHSAPPVEADGAPGETTLVGWLRNSPAHDPASR